MGIRIEGNLFYIQSKEMSMIFENKEGDLLLRHIGGKIAKYHGSNAILEKDHAFSGNPTPDNRTFSYDTQRQVFGIHGFGDFRQPSLSLLCWIFGRKKRP
ncbi:alpha-galactosidase [Streptococcus equinus]|nr:alpha-galactosidase [Streptococcus equinus]